MKLINNLRTKTKKVINLEKKRKEKELEIEDINEKNK